MKITLSHFSLRRLVSIHPDTFLVICDLKLSTQLAISEGDGVPGRYIDKKNQLKVCLTNIIYHYFFIQS